MMLLGFLFRSLIIHIIITQYLEYINGIIYCLLSITICYSHTFNVKFLYFFIFIFLIDNLFQIQPIISFSVRSILLDLLFIFFFHLHRENIFLMNFLCVKFWWREFMSLIAHLYKIPNSYCQMTSFFDPAPSPSQ